MSTNKLIGVFLDDERSPDDVTWIDYPENVEWVIVRYFEDFKEVVSENYQEISIISFDHDLQDYCDDGLSEFTGKTCVDWLVNLILREEFTNMPVGLFHTQNPIGKENMESLYNQLKRFINEQQ